MIVVNLKGGLGNQMFQYAAAYSLSLRKKVPILVDLRLMTIKHFQDNDDLMTFRNLIENYYNAMN